MSREIKGIITSHGFQESVPYSDNADKADNATVAEYASADTKKGTIETRLSALEENSGFLS